MASDEELKKMILGVLRLIQRSHAEVTALRLLLAEKGLFQHAEYQAALEIALADLERRRAQRDSESEIDIESLLKDIEGPIQ